MPKKLFLVDGSNHAFRVHFALPPMHAPDGFPTRALYGFITLLSSLLKQHQPDYVAVAFDDVTGRSFRHELYDAYKGNRPDMPEELVKQWPLLPGLVEAFGIACPFAPGFEADDVLATLAERFGGPELDVFLVTSDKDFGQVVTEHVHILDVSKNEDLGPAEVEAKYGVPPSKMLDLLSLSGDSSDNIPGVPGIGPKTAAALLAEHGDLDGVLAAAAAGKVKGKRGEALVEHAADARLSRDLARIVRDVDLRLALSDLRPRALDTETLRDRFDEWGFGKVARKLLPDRQAIDTTGYRSVDDLDALRDAVADIRRVGRVAVSVVEDLIDGEIRNLGVALCCDDDVALYVPLRHVEDQPYDAEAAAAILRPVLADSEVVKWFAGAKEALHALRRDGIAVDRVGGDVLLLDYLIAAHRGEHTLGDLAARHFGHTLVNLAALTEDGALQLHEVEVFELTVYAAERAHLAWKLHDRLADRADEGTVRVYREIELPLVPVLAEMERIGLRIDLDLLAEVSEDVGARAREAELRCYEIVGREFTIGSPKQLREILFDELGLPVVKNTKTGPSTDASVLEVLAEEHPLPEAILEARRLEKLKGTYLDTLPGYVADDGRIHTTFDQVTAATGRLSSKDPNLQNIPVRTPEGRRIRACFVPDEGSRFVSADYSQIELRVLAHCCGEPALVEAFTTGMDIHTRTAAEVFGVKPDEVTVAIRSAAKAINFGLLYGMSAPRLARDLQITKEQAQAYMDSYFGRMPKVEGWIEGIKEGAKRDGFVETLYGRRRILTTLDSQRWSERRAAEREAVNTVVQGTAADLIKIAMIRVSDAIRAERLKARLVLQVHDELLVEAPIDEVDTVAALLRREMEGVADLRVPLSVNTAVGASWNEAHG